MAAAAPLSAAQRAVVTAVIPTRNRAPLLHRAIDSVLRQSWPAVRVLVCDNASTDNTKALVEELAGRDPRVVYRRQPRDIGAVANFEYGLQAVDTPFFSFLSDDDVLLPGLYQRALEALAGQPEARFWLGVTAVHSEATGRHRLQPSRGWEAGLHPAGRHVALMIEHHFLWTATVFSREVRQRLGGLEPVPLADILYLARAAGAFPFMVDLSVGAVFRETGVNATTSLAVAELEQVHAAMLRRTVEIPGLDAAEQDAVRRAVDGNARAVANRLLRASIEAGDDARFAEVSSFLETRGWLEGKRRFKTALLRRVGLRSPAGRLLRGASRRGLGRQTADFEDVVARYS